MLEICLDGIVSAEAAAAAGADRVELCANLPEGGTTPSAGMIRAVRAAFPRGLMVIIRPRGYDFLYSDSEMAAMLDDIRMARDLGADGVVIGCLTADGRVDMDRGQRLIAAAGALDITFHRAFDMTRNLGEAMEDIIALGIKRILTSGGQPDVPAGIPTLTELVKQATGRVSIMPGGGVTEDNLGDIVRATGVTEIHLSARHPVRGGMIYLNPRCSMGSFSQTNEYEWRVASVEKIRLAKLRLVASRSAGVPPNAVHLAGGQVSHLSWPTGCQPVVSLADRRDALSSLTGWKPVLLPKGAKWTVLGVPPASAMVGEKSAPSHIPFTSPDDGWRDAHAP